MTVADRIAPDPATWRTSAIVPGTATPLVVDFPEPMDYSLLQRLLTVTGPHGTVPGTSEPGPFERQWRFTPLHSWKPGSHSLTIDTAVEDLAGNRINQPFDVDTFERVSRRVERRTVSLPLRLGSQ